MKNCSKLNLFAQILSFVFAVIYLIFSLFLSFESEDCVRAEVLVPFVAGVVCVGIATLAKTGKKKHLLFCCLMGVIGSALLIIYSVYKAEGFNFGSMILALPILVVGILYLIDYFSCNQE